MNKKFEKGHDDLLNSVAESASNLAKNVNKASKAMKNFGKKADKAKRHKPVVSASEMKTTTLYRGLSGGMLYRRLIDGNIEKLIDGSWIEVKVNYDFLNNEKFKEY